MKPYRIIHVLLLFLSVAFTTCHYKKLEKSQLPSILKHISNYHNEEGLLSNTLVKTPCSYSHIEDLCHNDIVIDIDHNPRAIVSIARTLVSRYVKITFDTEVICAACDQKFYLPEERQWITARNITPGCILCKNNSMQYTVKYTEIINKPAIAYILKVQDHIFCISKFDLFVHNTDLLTLGFVGINLGNITIMNPVTALIGATIALATLTPAFHKKIQIKSTNQELSDTQKLFEHDTTLSERYYYEQRKKDLEELKNTFLCILRELFTLCRSKSMRFTHHFFDQQILKCIMNHTTKNLGINSTVEQQLNSEQKKKLRTLRETELKQLEHEIIELQWILAIHLNELIAQRDRAIDSYDTETPYINKAHNTWNNNINRMTSPSIAFQLYEQDLIEIYFIHTIYTRNNELQQIIKYYKNSPTVACLKKSSNITDQIEQQEIITNETETWLKKEKERIASNTAIVENYFIEYQIPFTHFKQKTIEKLKKRTQELIKKELESAKEKRSTLPDPNNPNKNVNLESIYSKISLLNTTNSKKIWSARNKLEAMKLLSEVPSIIKENLKRFISKTSHKFNNYILKKLPCETYVLEITKPGNVPGSKAIYYKIISCTGETLAFFKDTFDHLGNLVHRKIK